MTPLCMLPSPAVPVHWGLVLLALVAGGCAAEARRTALAAPTDQLTLETIAGTQWVLRAWNVNDAAPAKPEVTLALKDGKFVGTAGCNRYFAVAKPGEMPGDVTVGPAGATRMMCPPERMAVEDRFLKQLAGVKTFGFMVGQLALSYEVDGVRGVMLFDRRGALPAA